MRRRGIQGRERDDKAVLDQSAGQARERQLRADALREVRGDDGRVQGVRVREETSGEEFDVHARAVILAGGVWTQEQQELAEAQVTGSAAGGLVTATVTGAGDVVSLKIKPEAVDPDDVETLEDLVVAALHDASRAAQALAAERMGPLSAGTGGLGLPGM